MGEFERFLDEGGEFVIKKEGMLMLLIPEEKIDGKTYRCGIKFSSLDELKEKLLPCAEVTLRVWKQKKQELIEKGKSNEK